MIVSGNDCIRISVVICTYRRPGMLRMAIESLLNQTLAAKEYEIIVIDNNSQDGTRDVVHNYIEAGSNKVCYVLEEQQGLSHARNTGVRVARGNVIAFLDDDAVADAKWLASLLEVYDSVPDAWAVGGKVLPIWGSERPQWLRDSMLRSLSTVEWGNERRLLKWPERIIGTNCSFRTRVFSEVGLFATNLGRQAILLLGNEDTEIQQRIHELGKLIFYTPHAVVYHHVPRERMTKKYFYSRAYGTGRSQAILTTRQDNVIVFLKRAFFSGVKLFWLCLSLAWNIRKEDTSFHVFQGLAYHFGYLKQAIVLLGFRKGRADSGTGQ